MFCKIEADKGLDIYLGREKTESRVSSCEKESTCLSLPWLLAAQVLSAPIL